MADGTRVDNATLAPSYVVVAVATYGEYSDAYSVPIGWAPAAEEERFERWARAVERGAVPGVGQPEEVTVTYVERTSMQEMPFLPGAIDTSDGYDDDSEPVAPCWASFKRPRGQLARSCTRRANHDGDHDDGDREPEYLPMPRGATFGDLVAASQRGARRRYSSGGQL